MTEVGLFEKSSACFTSKRGEYITPKQFFKELDDEFHFVLDPCTTVDTPLGFDIFTQKRMMVYLNHGIMMVVRCTLIRHTIPET